MPFAVTFRGSLFMLLDMETGSVRVKYPKQEHRTRQRPRFVPVGGGGGGGGTARNIARGCTVPFLKPHYDRNL